MLDRCKKGVLTNDWMPQASEVRHCTIPARLKTEPVSSNLEMIKLLKQIKSPIKGEVPKNS